MRETWYLYFLLMLMFVLLLTVIPSFALADEFSGKEVGKDWHVINPTGAGIVEQKEGLLTIKTPEGSQQNAEKDGAVKVLRQALEGEWIIETDLVAKSVKDNEYLHGLVIWKDAHNYLSFGCAGNLAKVMGVIDGQDTGMITKGSMMRYLRIRKITRGQDYATYHFYISGSGYQSFQWIGSYADEGHALDGAMYGLIGGSGLEGTSAYDSFTERLPLNEYDAFVSGRVDGTWKMGKGARGSQNNALTISGTAKELPHLALRPAFCVDWMIDTSLLYRTENEAVNGLLVMNETGDFLLLGARGADEVVVMLSQNGQTEELSKANTVDSRFLIAKEGNTYILSHSLDGSEWKKFYEFKDVEGILSGARYGFGCWGGEFLGATYSFFRERPTPTGEILGVKRLTEIGPMFGNGENVINHTGRRFWLGADLGHFLQVGDRMYQMYGDSNTDVNQSGTFWSNTLAIIDDEDPSDGLTFSEVISNKIGTPKEVIKAKHKDYDEVTCIPNTGVAIGNRIYYHYMSVYHWMPAGHWDVNGSGWAWSDDGGQTFHREPLCFAGDSGFIISCALQQDGYVYLYGIPSSKFEGVRLVRFMEEDILDEEKYEYCAGEDENGQVIWSPDVADAKEIIPGCTGEFCVIYHPQLEKYLIINQNVHTMDIEIRESERLTGGFGAPVVLVDHTIPQFNAYIYSPNTHAKYLLDEGKTMYFTLTRWNPYMVYWEKAELILRQEKQ